MTQANTSARAGQDAMQPLPYLDDLKTGDSLVTIAYEVTQEMVDAYGVASLDMNPVHMDPSWCERARVFGTPKPVQHGMMSMSYMASVVLRTYGPLAEIVSIDSKFTKPGPIGAKITCKGKVRDIHVLGNGRDYALVYVEATDQDGDIVGLSDVQVRLPRKPGARP
ncbi:MAG: MaoC family dehydratase [Ferrovibrio sp.]|uniref:MaoC family dehydratase n=1 Tax=Ferrovibrio sp. TaxID=1917215 RepID=UPI00391D60AC